jgi:16S rRNA C967 or C1407 C5-methylase (RsmB/RsmF family)
MIWDSIFDNDAHKIVSKQGQKELLIQLMHEDDKNGLYADYSDDMRTYMAQHRNEEELRKEGAIDFAKWLAKEWMSIWVVDKWMWEWQPERTPETIHMHLKYYTEEELYELYLKEQNEK